MVVTSYCYDCTKVIHVVTHFITSYLQQQKCLYRNDTIGARIKGFVDIEFGNEKQLMEAVATVGPVSVAIEAFHSSFIHYDGGIFPLLIFLSCLSCTMVEFDYSI